MMLMMMIRVLWIGLSGVLVEVLLSSGKGEVLASTSGSLSVPILSQNEPIPKWPPAEGVPDYRDLQAGAERPIGTSNCPLGHFPCEESPDLCVPQAAICNGKADCPNNSDEKACRNEHDDSFWDLYFPARPDKDSELVSEEYDCKYNVTALSHLPGSLETEVPSQWGLLTSDGCHCQWDKLLCQDLHLHNLSTVPWDVEYLDLSGSIVETLDLNSPPSFPHLQHLVLSSCAISEISHGAFYKLRSLRTLHLTGNQLGRVPSKAFETNIKLEKLFLGHNQISRLEPGSFLGLLLLNELDLRNNLLEGSELKDAFHGLSNLRTLHLSGNGLEEVLGSYFSGLDHLEILSLSGNRITSIEPNAFSSLSNLKRLYLSWNRVEVLYAGIFCNLRSLLDLHLNGNAVSRIEMNAFSCLDSLESLNLANNRFQELSSPAELFQNLTGLQHIYFDQFWMCWWAPHVRSCEPKGDGISSVENLLDNIILRVCVWIMGLVGIVGNFFVIVSRLVIREPNPIHSFYIKNLALADLLMGIFLFSIAVHDLKFRGRFLAAQHSWRHSLTCQLSGVLSAWSSEASVLILALITLDRYLSIVRPFAERRATLSCAVGGVSFLWLLSFSLSYLPLSGLGPGYFMNVYSSNGLCLPLQIHNPWDSGWEYSFSLFILLNSAVFTFILYAYWRMLRVIRDSSVTLRTNQERQDGVLAMRFSLIVLTDFLCWAPVIGAKALAMSGIVIPSEMYAWLAVFVLPVNSMLNPIIYTLTTKLFRQQLSKLGAGFRKKWARRGQSEESSVSLSLFSRARAQRQTITTSIHNSLRSSLAGSGKSNLHVHLGNGKGPVPNLNHHPSMKPMM